MYPFLDNWLAVTIFTLLILGTFLFFSRYLNKFQFRPIDNIQSVNKNPDRYLFYFLVLAVYVPTTEILIEFYK
jgi:hypothetical protein